MELVLGTFAALGGTAGATAAAGTAAGVTAGGATLFTASNVLQGLATGASAIAAIGQGAAKANEADLQAELLKTEAAEQRFVTESEAAKLKRSLADTVSGQVVAMLSSGASLDGSARIKLGQTIDDGQRDADLLAATGQSRQTAISLRRQSARARASISRAQGFVTAAGRTVGFLGDLHDRS